jgi:hypothetical protein
MPTNKVQLEPETPTFSQYFKEQASPVNKNNASHHPSLIPVLPRGRIDLHMYSGLGLHAGQTAHYEIALRIHQVIIDLDHLPVFVARIHAEFLTPMAQRGEDLQLAR